MINSKYLYVSCADVFCLWPNNELNRSFLKREKCAIISCSSKNLSGICYWLKAQLFFKQKWLAYFASSDQVFKVLGAMKFTSLGWMWYRILRPLLAFVSTFFLTLLLSFCNSNHCLKYHHKPMVNLFCYQHYHFYCLHFSCGKKNNFHQHSLICTLNTLIFPCRKLILVEIL